MFVKQKFLCVIIFNQLNYKAFVFHGHWVLKRKIRQGGLHMSICTAKFNHDFLGKEATQRDFDSDGTDVYGRTQD